MPHGLANAILLPMVLREYGCCIDKKLHNLAVAAGLADKNTPDHEAAELFIQAIEEMKQKFGIVPSSIASRKPRIDESGDRSS